MQRCPWLRVAARCVWVLFVVLTAIGCKEKPSVPLSPSLLTSAELRTIRRGVTVSPRGESPREPYERERLGDGAVVKIEEGGVAWVRRDGGTTLLVQGPGVVTLDDGTLRVDGGRVFAETPSGKTETVLVPSGALVLSAVRSSLEVSGKSTEAYVLEGEMRFGATIARAGERLMLEAGSGSAVQAKVEPALSWDDWTGGLATTDRASEPAPFGVGTVGARLPGTQGTPYFALSIQRLDVRVRIEGDLAITEVDQTFFNPQSTTVEGIYRFRVPEGALLERFGVDREGGILYGYVKEKSQAKTQYESHVYAGSKEDPALLEWEAPGEYQARLYPIGPGATRRVVVRYTEWLTREGARGERRLYTYPMAFEGTEASAPQIEDMSIEVDLSSAGAKTVRSGAAAVRAEDMIVVRDHDVVPRADFSLELLDDGAEKPVAVRAPHRPDRVALGPSEAADERRTGKDEADYVLVPVRAGDIPRPEEGLDLVVVVDTSAATDKAMLRLARSATRALVSHLGARDRLLVLAGDDRLRPVGKHDTLTQVDDAMKAEVLEALAKVEPGGASDLGAMLAEATTKVGDQRATSIVYIGDGLSTVGETDLASIRARLKKAPRLVRTFGLGIGDGAGMAMLSGLSTGGFAERVTDDRSAAKAALRLLETAERTVELGATVDLGPEVERVYPRELGAVVAGRTAMVVGRVRGDTPREIKVVTTRGTTTIPVATKDIKDEGDLRRRWAVGRLDELLSQGAGPSALVDLGVRQGIITPVTSVYVPTSGEMTREQRASIDREVRKRTKLVKQKPEQEKMERQLAQSDSGGDGKTAKKDERGDDASARGNLFADQDGNSAPVAAATAAPMASPAASANARASGELAKVRAKGEEGAMGGDKDAPTAGWGRRDDEPQEAPRDVRSQPAKEERHVDMPPAPPTANEAKKLGSVGGGSGAATPTPDVAEATTTEQSAPGAKPTEAPSSLDPSNGVLDRERRDDIVIRKDESGRVIVIVDDPGRVVRRCGQGANLPFEGRKALWRERLSGTRAQPSAVLQIYKNALAWCEAPTMRERRALLLMSFDYLPSVASRVSLFRLLANDPKAQDVVYRGILARVTTPVQVRELNQALGLQTVDPGTLETTIKDNPDPAVLAAKLRLLRAKFPDDLTLALRLVDALEDANDAAGARLLARELRQRSDADARVRTSAGELYLRLAARGSGDQRKADEDEAKRAFGEIVEFSPEDPVARRRLGDLYRAHGFFAEAARQYETLGRLVPDDPTAMLLLAASENGLGKLEEALRWIEKGGQAGAPDVSQGPHATARAFAALFIAWGRLDAKAAGREDERRALGTRLDKLLSGARREGTARVILSWSHPELHPSLWSDAAGTMMPAGEGDATLGLSQSIVSDRSGATIEVRVEPTEIEHAARLGAKATLTVVFGEGKDAEVVLKREVSFAKDAPLQRFRIERSNIEPVAIERAEPAAGAHK